MVVAFCGHSDFNKAKENEEKILEFLEKKIGDKNAELYLGGYGSFDSFAHKCGKKFTSTHPNTKLVLITAYITAEYQKNHLEQAKLEYDYIIYPEIEKVPLRFAITYRNRWMVL